MNNEKCHDAQIHPILCFLLRKRWMVVAGIIGFLWLAGWFVFRERSLAVLRLPNGQKFTVHKLTYGTDHRYWGKPTPLTAVEKWANRGGVRNRRAKSWALAYVRLGTKRLRFHAALVCIDRPERVANCHLNPLVARHFSLRGNWARSAGDATLEYLGIAVTISFSSIGFVECPRRSTGWIEAEI